MVLRDAALRRAIILCVAVGVLDFSQSIPLPLFPGFAQTRGADLAMIGLYGSMVGLAMVLLGVPVGSLSDRVGRRLVVAGGAVLFSLVPIVFLLSTSPILLLAGRFLQGLATGATFTLGFLWVSEIAPLSSRPFLQGLYMTCMGVGYTFGPLVGGHAYSLWGYTGAFLLSTSCCLVAAFLFAATTDSRPERRPDKPPVSLRELVGDRRLLAAGVMNVGNSVMFNTVGNFFPLYAASLGLLSSDVGFALMVRGVASTAVRFPAGAASKGGKATAIMALGLLLAAVSSAGFLFAPSFPWICVILAGLGVVYGANLTSGNVFVTETSTPETRGASMGFYSGLGNAANVAAPLLLGFVGQAFGLTAVFLTTGSVCVVCVVLLLALSRTPKASTS